MDGWLLVLSGHKFDFLDWLNSFPPGYDPTVVAFEEVILLSSLDLTKANDVDNAYEIGTAILPRLNGLMQVLHGTDPLSIEAVGKFDDAGNLIRSVFMSAHLSGRSRFTATATLLDPNGEEIKLVPKPTIAQEMAETADNDDLLADALHYVSESTSWFNLYKAFECITQSVGGEAKLKAMAWVSKSEIERFKRTANSIYRHRRGHFDPPSNPMSNKDAASLLRLLILKRFDQSNSNP